MTTERLYYDDSYTLAFNAEVVETAIHKDRPALVLDRTYFYPEGGGQPPDHGSINGVKVLDVQTREADRAVLHVMEQPLNDHRIEGQIEAERRLDHMQHHSGQHVLSQALSQAARAETLSVHMSADSMTIDVNRPYLSANDWLAVEELANRIVMEDRRVRTWFPEPDELAALQLRKLPDVAGKVRVVDVGGFDITACGGTHVAHTGEIGQIKVVRFERRGDTTRLEFKCGRRALSDYRDKNRVINQLAVDMTVGYWELPDAIQRLQTEAKALRSELKTAREHLMDAEALALLPTAVQHGDWRFVSHVYKDREASEVRLLAQKLAAQSFVIALLGVAGDPAHLIFACAVNVNADMSQALKVGLAHLRSERGGGRPNFAQGGGVKASQDEVKAAIQLAADSIRQANERH
ncbi:MAG TPA: DHHA1 domain-containing protein [Aggregatilineales bacterium]|nr:DHHA1 domain-containing protein [Aggregatilineales bacterium]